MKPICYKNTKSLLPNWNPNEIVHSKFPLGYAYETDTHFVHFFGSNTGFYPIQVGLCVIEGKTDTLIEWVEKVFGAKDIQEMYNDVGTSIEGVWRPSLYYTDDVNQALNYTDSQMRYSEQAIRQLVEKLDEILKFIQPDPINYNVYGYRIRELLILTCTEIENIWQYYMKTSSTLPRNGRTYNTNDYVQLLSKLYLSEYSVKLKSYENINQIKPFANWNVASPTTSLQWYDAYNKTKHDRDSNFTLSNLENILISISACLVMHIVHFGPWSIIEQNNTFASIVNQHFQFEIVQPDIRSFYIHLVNMPGDTRKDRFVFDPHREGFTPPFIRNNLVL